MRKSWSQKLTLMFQFSAWPGLKFQRNITSTFPSCLQLVPHSQLLRNGCLTLQPKPSTSPILFSCILSKLVLDKAWKCREIFLTFLSFLQSALTVQKWLFDPSTLLPYSSAVYFNQPTNALYQVCWLIFFFLHFHIFFFFFATFWCKKGKNEANRKEKKCRIKTKPLLIPWKTFSRILLLPSWIKCLYCLPPLWLMN